MLHFQGLAGYLPFRHAVRALPGPGGGSILYVVSELLPVGRHFALREAGMWGIFLRFMAGSATDLIVTWGGA